MLDKYLDRDTSNEVIVFGSFLENVYVEDHVGDRTFIWIFGEHVVRNGSGWNWVCITSSARSTVVMSVCVLQQSAVMSGRVNI